jgi:hypothetical protein
MAQGMPRSIAAGTGQLDTNFWLTENKGNMVIGEAAGRLFDVDRQYSCFLRITRLRSLGWDPERICAAIHQHFDLVVLIMANGIRPNWDFADLADILGILKTNFVVLGLGMQTSLPPSLDALPAGSRRFLKLLEQKALLFGVRGHETAAWLQSAGIRNAKVLGCPSLYLYPDNFLAIRPPQLSAETSAISAGYLGVQVPRSRILCSLLRDVAGDYVVQTEILPLIQASKNDGTLYNDATGRLNHAVCQKVFGTHAGALPPFRGYWYFQSVDAWRVFCARADYFLGDRLHGGIVAMQAGIPSIMLWNDLRVREIAQLCAIPNREISSITTEHASDLVETLLSPAKLEQFRDTYQMRLACFDEATTQCGLKRDTNLPRPVRGASPFRKLLRKLRS